MTCRQINRIEAVLLLAVGIPLMACGIGGCRKSAVEPEPAPVVVEDVPPPPVEPSAPFDASLVVKANELEAKLEGRLLWEAARKCKAREFTSDVEARDWLKARWRKCEENAIRGDESKGIPSLLAAEANALAWPEGGLDQWLDNAAEVWAAEAKASDSSLKGESL